MTGTLDWKWIGIGVVVMIVLTRALLPAEQQARKAGGT